VIKMTKYQKDIELCKEFIHTKVWRKDENQEKKWNNFLSKLSELHNVEFPTLFVGEEFIIPCYDRYANRIFLTKYSVISLLHEFGHIIFGNNEQKCVEYSEIIFLTAYPKAKRYLKRDNREYLVKGG